MTTVLWAAGGVALGLLAALLVVGLLCPPCLALLLGAAWSWMRGGRE